jgi:hypothetical protein
MKKKHESKADDEKPLGLTIYKPEGQVYQKLHLCEYRRELYESTEQENELGAANKKDLRPHAPKDYV